jgi:uroporphyrin-3 C-methyltransferase
VNNEISETESDAPEIPPEKFEIKENKAEESSARESKPRRSGGGLPVLAFLFSLAALAGAGWMWWQDRASSGQEEKRVFAEITRLESSDSELSLKLSQLRNEMDSLAAGDVGAEFAALQKRLEADRSKMGDVEQAISEQLRLSRSLQAAADSMQGRLAAAEAALTGMSTRELDAGGELDIAEVDYLLRLANERLKLFSDPAAADQALEVADMHLAALDNPIYLGVRQEIAAARHELAAVNLPDYLGIASQLDAIQQEIASLPFSQENPVSKSATVAEKEGWWEKVKGVFSNLVTVRRSTDEENKRISLQDKDYIRQRVWLQLEVAHLSLMRRDQEAFRSSLERVEESLSAWFDTSHAAYQAIKQDLDDLLALQVQVNVPDITAPWSMLQLLRASQSRPVQAPQNQQQLPLSDPEPETDGE